MLSVKEAQNKVLDFDYKPEKGRLDISKALGFVFSDNIFSPADMPAEDIAALDGYALRAVDIKGADRNYPIRLKVYRKETSDVSEPFIEPGFCTPIFEGAPIPRGCDCVVPREATESGKKDILIYDEYESNQNIVQRGEDVKKGKMIFPSGRRIYPKDIGILGQMGIYDIEVYLPPRVAIVTVYPKSTPRPAKPDSRGLMLSGLLTATGAGCRSYSVRYEDGKAVKAKIAKIKEGCDFLAITGSKFIGEYAFLNDVMLEMDLELGFWKVNQDPGRNLAFLTGNNKAVFCIGGNLTMLLICFEVYLRPLLLKMMQRKDLFSNKVNARAIEHIRNKRGKTSLVTVCLEKKQGVYYFKPLACGMLSSIKSADGIAFISEDTIGLQPGEVAEVLKFDKNM